MAAQSTFTVLKCAKSKSYHKHEIQLLSGPRGLGQWTNGHGPQLKAHPQGGGHLISFKFKASDFVLQGPASIVFLVYSKIHIVCLSVSKLAISAIFITC